MSDDGSVIVMVDGAHGGAVMPHELEKERQARIQAQQQLADARRGQIEAARLAARNGAQTVEQQRLQAQARIKDSFESGDWDKAAQAQAELADLAVARAQWAEYGAKLEAEGNTEAAQEKWLASQHPNHRAFIRAHPEFFTDTAFQKKCVEASGEAVRRGYQADDPRHLRFVEEQVGLRPRDGAGADSGYHGAATQISARQSPAGPAVHISQRAGGVDDPNEPSHLDPQPDRRRVAYSAPPTGAGRDFSGQRSFIDGTTTAQISADEAHHAKYLFPDVSEAEALRKYINNKKLLIAEKRIEPQRRDGY